MTQVFSPLRIERIPGDPRYVRLLRDFGFYSDILERLCKVPALFVEDEESVPLFKGTNPEAGLIHDYFSRKDSDPIVSKEVAAKIYFEFQEYFDKQEKGWMNKIWDWIRRKVKADVVIVAPGYFHKHCVMATYEEMVGES
jgi:hypothetical protein